MAIFEAGIEHRFGMPVLPVSDYGQALCRKCGLLYVNAKIDNDYLLELYSQENVAWQQEYVGDAMPWNGGTNDEELRRFSSIVELTAKFRDVVGIKWLDFGCQTGELGKIAQDKYSVRMFGVEVSEDYASRSDKLWGGQDTVRSSIASFLSEGSKFDVISALETLEHIANPWETASDLRRALAPDGLLVVTVPSAQYFRLKYHVFKIARALFSKRSVRNTGGKGRSMFGLCHTHPYNFSPASLSLLLARAGFATIYVGGSGWSKRFWFADLIGRLISFATRRRVQIFPSVVAVARISSPGSNR